MISLAPAKFAGITNACLSIGHPGTTLGMSLDIMHLHPV